MQLDESIFLFLFGLSHQSNLLDFVIVFFGVYASYLLIVIFLGLIFFKATLWTKKFEIVLLAVSSIVLSRLLIVPFIRHFWPRLRPFIEYNITPLFTDYYASFPSGYASFFFALSFIVYYYDKFWGKFFIATSILITISRVMGGVHYLSDIIVGSIIGFLSAYLLYFYVWPKAKVNYRL